MLPSQPLVHLRNAATELTRRAAAGPFPARGVYGDLAVFVAGARPITDATAELSSVPPGVFAP
jgi:hypothetical protein